MDANYYGEDKRARDYSTVEDAKRLPYPCSDACPRATDTDDNDLNGVTCQHAYRCNDAVAFAIRNAVSRFHDNPYRNCGHRAAAHRGTGGHDP